jgi:hypothetical protein
MALNPNVEKPTPKTTSQENQEKRNPAPKEKAPKGQAMKIRPINAERHYGYFPPSKFITRYKSGRS